MQAKDSILTPVKFIYLLHFDEPISHAQHYAGITTDLAQRFEAHFNGTGSVLTAEFADRGIGFVVARIWRDATIVDERSIKNQKNGPRFCPYCHPHTYRRNLNKLKRVPTKHLNASGIQTIFNHESESE